MFYLFLVEFLTSLTYTGNLFLLSFMSCNDYIYKLFYNVFPVQDAIYSEFIFWEIKVYFEHFSLWEINASNLRDFFFLWISSKKRFLPVWQTKPRNYFHLKIILLYHFNYISGILEENPGLLISIVCLVLVTACLTRKKLKVFGLTKTHRWIK